MSDTKNIIKISDYYKDINIEENLLDNNLKNLLYLTANNDINIFSSSKNKNKNKLKNKKKIIKDCKNLKKIKLGEFTKELSNYSTFEENIDSHYIESRNNEYINNIKNIDKIIKILNDDNELLKLKNIVSEKKRNNFIEIYSNN
jgi:hypothetical protein